MIKSQQKNKEMMKKFVNWVMNFTWWFLQELVDPEAFVSLKREAGDQTHYHHGKTHLDVDKTPKHDSSSSPDRGLLWNDLPMTELDTLYRLVGCCAGPALTYAGQLELAPWRPRMMLNGDADDGLVTHLPLFLFLNYLV